MSTLMNDWHRHSTRVAAWRLDHSGSTFELTVKPRSGPIRVMGSIRLADGLLRIDSAGAVQMSFGIDTDGIEISGGHRDPRLLSRTFPGVEGNAVIPFESTRVIDQGAGRLHVTGRLAVGAKHVPLDFAARVTITGGSLEIAGTAVVDHRRLGMTWLPAGPLKAPTEVVLRARLIPITDHDPRATTAMARAPAPPADQQPLSLHGRSIREPHRPLTIDATRQPKRLYAALDLPTPPPDLPARRGSKSSLDPSPPVVSVGIDTPTAW
jgi:polyisoprenoid-binding protein YceI